MKGNTVVQQTDRDGELVMDYDTSLSAPELYETVRAAFPGITGKRGSMICGEYRGKKYALRVKNVTYLGTPHPAYKKRIQISGGFRQFCDEAFGDGRMPLLIGVYTYRDTLLFCDFFVPDFINKRANNSSAHVSVGDLAAAAADGIYQKTDFFGNRITTFRPDAVNLYLDDKLGLPAASGGRVSAGSHARPSAQAIIPDGQVFIPDGQAIIPDGQAGAPAGRPAFLRRIAGPAASPAGIAGTGILAYIADFFASVPPEWHGIACYQEMMRDDYRNKFQPEWAGFYLEYRFEKYLAEHSLQPLITYAQDKRAGGVDLDLFFPTLGAYGDLKAHSCASPGIQGNDLETVAGLLERPGGAGHVYYIVAEHDTLKDSECGYEVTEFWNRALGKSNLRSYGGRMKNRVRFRKAYILDINGGNRQYLSVFRQGVNSNGRLREPKIMIDRERIRCFCIREIPIQ